jgi:hypothetical protein
MSGQNWFDGGEAPHLSGLNPECPPLETANNQDGVVRVTGRIHNSGNLPYPGWVRVTAQDTIGSYSRSPRTVVSKRPTKFIIPNSGLVDLLLLNSVDSGSVYLFEIGYTETVLVETVPTPRDTITDSWYAQVPRPSTVGGSVNLADLLPTPISRDRLDTSVLRIAEAIVTDPELRSKAVAPFRITGVFDPARSYTYGDLVTIVGSPYQTWVCTTRAQTVPAALPLSPTTWLRLL